MPRSTTASTTYQSRDIGFAGGRRNIEFRQLVNLTGSASNVPLGFNIPPRSRVVWCRLLNYTAIQVTGNDATNTANCAALMMWPTTATQAVTAPTTTATQSNPTGTNGTMLMRGATTSINDIGRGGPLLQTSFVAQNTASVEAFLALVPAFTNSNRVYANGTSGFVFGTATNQTATAGQVQVELEIEQFADGASW